MPINKELIFTMQQQLQDNWCWAANAASISHFYDINSNWSQCGIACNTLTRQDCCLTANPNPCNQPWYLDRALVTTSNFKAPVINRPLQANEIMSQIDSGLIIGVRIGWFGGGGHFVSIYGYNSSPSGFYVYLGDPIYGNSTANLDNFTTNYQGSGSWTHSYFTKTPIASMLQFTAINESILQQATLLKESSLFSKDKKLIHDSSTPSSLTSPHEVFIVSLQSLKEGNPNFHKGGFRVIDADQNGTKRIYDFDDNVPNAKLQQVIHSNTFSQKYEGVLENLFESQRKAKATHTLRIIRQPELKIEAFWLHSNEHPESDSFIPVIAPSILHLNETYSKESFFKLLENAAKIRKTYDDNLLGG